MGKYKGRHYFQQSREMFKGNPSVFQGLSENANKLLTWLHECEHQFSGPKEDWFWRSNQELAQDCNMRIGKIKRAKKELREKGLIETWNMHWIDPKTNKKSHKHVTAYRILG